jgi:16S rRNA (cytosine1402-N4)-methyltransferase
MSAALGVLMVVETEFSHVPVLLAETLEYARQVEVRQIVDCTVGGAGHATALLEAFPQARLLGIDRDPTAVRIATERLARFGARARVVHGHFAELAAELRRADIEAPRLILADFGVSSHQLDTPARGFSFRAEGALDMRMDTTKGPTAAELLERLDEVELTRAIRTLGEERYARRVARAIVAERPRTTEALADLVRRVVPKSKDRLDPATRTFQALRMLVNRELEEIDAWLTQAPECLADDGVLIAISFHSLEDRAVKAALRQGAKGCICPARFPVCACGRTPTLRLLTAKARQPSEREMQTNPRARSARLRAALRLKRLA